MRRFTAAIFALIVASGIAGCVQHTAREGIATCTGSQVITVDGGQTLTGLIEAKVQTAPEERLKSGANLTLIAKAITADGIEAQKPDSNVIIVYPDYGDMPAAQLSAGSHVALPKECHANAA